MKKKDFVTLILSAVGGILFALGMCMALVPEWGAMAPGIAIGVVGAVILLVMILVRRKMDGKPAIVFNGKAIGTTLLGVAGAIVLGVGMCMVMVWEMLIPGVIVGIVGIVAIRLPNLVGPEADRRVSLAGNQKFRGEYCHITERSGGFRLSDDGFRNWISPFRRVFGGFRRLFVRYQFYHGTARTGISVGEGLYSGAD